MTSSQQASGSLRLTYIDDGVPKETTRQLRAACETRDVAFAPVDPGRFDLATAEPLGYDDLLYRPAVSNAAMMAEQWLYSPSVATFYTDPGGPFFSYSNSTVLFARAGLATPRSFPVIDANRERLRSHVEVLGGLPVVVKLLGWSGGVGTMRVDSLPALFSLIDLLKAQGNTPWLMAYIPDAVHWRVIVLGAAAIAAYTNPREVDDFRTFGNTDPAAFTTEVPPRLATLAVGAVAAQRLEFGGVDILEHASGRLYLLEANFPCYFAHAMEFGGFDIAGPMVDHLIAKARRLRAGHQTDGR